MPALRIATKPIEEASKIASVYQKAKITNAQNVVNTPKKAPVDCILSSMAHQMGPEGGGRGRDVIKSLSNIPRQQFGIGVCLEQSLPG